MKKFTIISDSSCDLRTHDLTDNQIDFTTVPISYRLGEEDFNDTEDSDISTLTTKMKENKQAPKTACPSVETFAEVMRSASTEHIFVLTLSSKLSGTYNSARLAAEEVANKKIFVFDSLTTSAGLARIIYKLVKLIKEDKYDFDALCEKLPEIRSRNKIRFFLHNLGNLVKSGRMSKVLGIITSVIPLKLICGDNGEGEIKKYKQVLGAKKGIEALAQFPAECHCEEERRSDLRSTSLSYPDPTENLIVISHCNNMEGAGTVTSILNRLGFKNIKTLLMRGIATFFANDKGIAIAY